MLILASKSPRRKEILTLAGLDFVVKESNQAEDLPTNLPFHQMAEKIALAKAQVIADIYPNDIVIGADTIVVIDNIILGKPINKEDAQRMLKLLSGRTHQVITGVVIIKGKEKIIFSDTTNVSFYPMTDKEINDYIESEQVYDKAGSYAIQGSACKYISHISGDYYNVMGMPIARLYQHLKSLNY